MQTRRHGFFMLLRSGNWSEDVNQRYCWLSKEDRTAQKHSRYRQPAKLLPTKTATCQIAKSSTTSQGDPILVPTIRPLPSREEWVVLTFKGPAKSDQPTVLERSTESISHECRPSPLWSTKTPIDSIRGRFTGSREERPPMVTCNINSLTSRGHWNTRHAADMCLRRPTTTHLAFLKRARVESGAWSWC